MTGAGSGGGRGGRIDHVWVSCRHELKDNGGFLSFRGNVPGRNCIFLQLSSQGTIQKAVGNPAAGILAVYWNSFSCSNRDLKKNSPCLEISPSGSATERERGERRERGDERERETETERQRQRETERDRERENAAAALNATSHF